MPFEALVLVLIDLVKELMYLGLNLLAHLHVLHGTGEFVHLWEHHAELVQ
jgi:hypothetical protein